VTSTAKGRSPQTILLLAALAQNVSIGFTFGTYGVLLLGVEETFGASRSALGAGLALTTLVMGLLSPAVGGAMERFSIRSIMMLGAFCLAAGLVGASQASHVGIFLASFGGLAAVGVTLMGPLPCAALVTHWFDEGRGKAMGLVMAPLGVMLMPPLAGFLAERWGWQQTCLGLGLATLPLIPAFLLLQDQPAKRMPAPGAVSTDPAPEAPGMGPRELLRRKPYWAVALAGGLLLGGSNTIITHMVPMVSGWGIPLSHASMIVAVQGAAGMVGALLFGAIADRLGPARALTLNATLQVGAWSLLLLEPGFAAMLVVAFGVGMGAGSVFAVIGLLVAKLFGEASFGRAMGLFQLLVVPFNFGAPLLAGSLYDWSGTYKLSLAIHMLSYAVAAGIFLLTARHTNSPSH
jgi:MFS family permease